MASYLHQRRVDGLGLRHSLSHRSSGLAHQRHHGIAGLGAIFAEGDGGGHGR